MVTAYSCISAIRQGKFSCIPLSVVEFSVLKLCARNKSNEIVQRLKQLWNTM